MSEGGRGHKQRYDQYTGLIEEVQKKKEDFLTGPGEEDGRGARLWGMGHKRGVGRRSRRRDVRCVMCDVRGGERERRALVAFEDGRGQAGKVPWGLALSPSASTAR